MYDYIIVGGGSAGCVLANRLSANGKYSVCLLEAGTTDRNPLIHMPLGVIPLVRGIFANWRFWSEPQSQLNGRNTYQPRGKTLGGSSSINAMVCTRGHASDYDQWQALGCDGWSFDEVLPYFIKSESYQAPLAAEDQKFHGGAGPLKVTQRRYTNPLSQAFVAAGQEAGHPFNDDFNGAKQEGVGQFKVFQKNGRRCSNAAAYLTPEVKKRANLTIMTQAQVCKIDLHGNKAVGLYYKTKGRGKNKYLAANKEIILSAGAFQSPQLLLLSGIGPAAELKQHNVPLLHELPGVGENLQDHLNVIVQTQAKTKVGSSFHYTALPRVLLAIFQYFVTRKGMLTSNGPESGGFVKSSPQQSIPDLQWHFGAFPSVYHGFKLAPLFQGYSYIAYVYDLRPKSRGRVGLKNNNPMSAPLIDPQYLTEPADVDTLLAGIHRTRELFAQPAFDAHRLVETSPGPEIQSDQELKTWLRSAAETTYHPVGTCKMGTDDMAVVNTKLQVQGIQGLRVVDASIMPTLIGANTNAATTMIAEKAADMILKSTHYPQH